MTTWANEFLRVLARSPDNIKDMVRGFSAAEIEEANDICFWMYQCGDERRSLPKNIEGYIEMSIDLVFRDHCFAVMPCRGVWH